MDEFSRLVRAAVRWGICLLAASASVAFGQQFVPEEEPVRMISVRADIWLPINGKPGSECEGYGIEIMREVFHRHGIEVDYQLSPWKRALEDVKTGVVDAVIGATRYEARNLVSPTEPIGRFTTGLFTSSRSTWIFTGPESLKEVRISAILGYDYGEVLNRHLQEHKEDPELVDWMGGADAFEKNLTKLERGLIDVIPEAPEVFAAQVVHLGRKLDDFRMAGQTGDVCEVFVAFSPKHRHAEEFRQIWDSGMANLREEGTLEKILAKYGIQDWKGHAETTLTRANGSSSHQ